MDSVSTTFFLDLLLQVDKSSEGQFIQLMALQQKITELVDPPGKNRDVEEILLQVAQLPRLRRCSAANSAPKNTSRTEKTNDRWKNTQFIKETIPCIFGTFDNLYECGALLFLIESEILLLKK